MAENEMAADLVTLVDDDGNEHEFEIVDTLELGEQRYVALVAANDPDDDAEDDGELVVLKSVIEDDEEFLEAIEDEAEFDQVAGIFMEHLQDEFDFIDGEDEAED